MAPTTVTAAVLTTACWLHLMLRQHRMSGLEFLLVVGILLGTLAALGSSPSEKFDEQQQAPMSMQNASFVAKLASIPTQVKDIIVPALDKLVQATKTVPEGGIMSRFNYPEADTDQKFLALVQEYRRVDNLLSSMKSYDRAAYEKVLAAAPSEDAGILSAKYYKA